MPFASLMRTPLTATFFPALLWGLKRLAPSNWYRRLPNGLAAVASVAANDADCILVATGSLARVNIHVEDPLCARQPTTSTISRDLRCPCLFVGIALGISF